MIHHQQNSLEIKGFEFSAISCGIKEPETLDLALIYSENSASIGGVFTKNRVVAAPVVLDRERLKSGKGRAVLVNSGCANACTGEGGQRDAIQSCRWAAEALDIGEEEVFVASTGVIGTRLPMRKIQEGMGRLTADLNKKGLPYVAQAIMTTDTVPKWVIRSGQIGDALFRIGGVAKGAGMIHPQMATMLCFVMTDAAISSDLLQKMLSAALPSSFHAITVDGDTSTNDTILSLASGASGAPEITEGSKDGEAFAGLLKEVLTELALSVVQDAEGATKLIQIQIEGASDDEAALSVGKTIAHSPLVKTAFYGEDVNWGRILAAVGYSGVRIDPTEIELWYDHEQIVEAGCGVGTIAEEKAKQIARKKEFTVRVSLGSGTGKATLYTCDLSHDYITINASYKT